MSTANQFSVALSTREAAIAVWAFIVMIWIVSNGDTRRALFAVPKLFLSWPILRLFIPFVAYEFGVVCLLSEAHFWNPSMLKDTLIWFFGPAVLIFANADKVSKGWAYYRDVLLQGVGFSAVASFVTSQYTFHILGELALVPTVVLFGALSAVAVTKAEYAFIGRLISTVIGLIGLIMAAFAVSSLAHDVGNFASWSNLQNFLLAPVLSTAALPLIYFVALIAAYETLFVRVGVLLRPRKEMCRVVKKEIVKECRLDLAKLMRFAHDFANGLTAVGDEGDIQSIMREFRHAHGVPIRVKGA